MTRYLREIRAAAAAVVLLAAQGMPIGQAQTAATRESAAPPRPNRLIESNNPYLLSHAYNPVDWHSWGPEALAKARREDKPIFLSVGYSTCYWCHVAERTIYSNPEIAALMNQWFVNIKVDREQRPDIDQIYMTATHLLTGRGGWPNNVFLTPDLKPIFAGSYFPPEDDAFGRPGFPTILRELHEAWVGKRAATLAYAERAFDLLRRAIHGEEVERGQGPIDADAWLMRVRDFLLQRLDTEHGGLLLGNGPKFPHETMIALMLAEYGTRREKRALEWISATLDAMAYGGIRDHLAGGFHRYSTERTWSVPHFEKMLYDNAQLLQVYADAYQVTLRPLYNQVAQSLGDYLGGAMMDPDGGFYTALDAEIDGEEGASYVWAPDEIRAVLGEADTKILFQVFGLSKVPQRAGGAERGVLRVRLPIADTLERVGRSDPAEMLAAVDPIRKRLLAARNARPQPALDRKIVVSLNGLAILSLAKGSMQLDRPELLEWARRAAERIWVQAYDRGTGMLAHEIHAGRAQTPGYLSDYALLGLGFVALGEKAKDATWQVRAAEIADALLKRFARADGSLATSQLEKELPLAPTDTDDSTVPSGTAATIDLLLQLLETGRAGSNVRFLSPVGKMLRYMSNRIEQQPESWPSLIMAAQRRPHTVAEALAATAEPSAARSAARAATGKSFGLDTADHVRASAVAERGTEVDRVAITLEIDRGFHVNANPAAFDFLVPTTVSFKGVSPTEVLYPKADRFKAAFADGDLDVYQGVVTLVARFAAGGIADGAIVEGTVTAQACTDRICLPPAAIPVKASLAPRQ